MSDGETKQNLDDWWEEWTKWQNEEFGSNKLDLLELAVIYSVRSVETNGDSEMDEKTKSLYHAANMNYGNVFRVVV